MPEQSFLKLPVREFIDLCQIYPEETIKCKQYRIDTRIMEKRFYDIERIRFSSVPNSYFYRLDAYKDLFDNKPFKRLIVNETGEDNFDPCMMSDTAMERASNKHFIKNANGDVLIFGLGLGMIVFPLLNASDVTSITIVELHQELINLVGPFIKRHDIRDIVTIQCGDMFKYTPENTFDTIYCDIWPTYGNLDIYNEQKTCKRKLKRFLNTHNPKAFINAWMFEHHKNLKKKGLI